jgi:hypothetical protein
MIPPTKITNPTKPKKAGKGEYSGRIMYETAWRNKPIPKNIMNNPLF